MRNIIWNLSGFVIPVLSAIISIPIIISHIGVERFGVLTLIFAMIGFMNIFDFGLTRSITNSIIKYKEINERGKVFSTIKTGFAIILTISFLISIIIQILSNQIVHTVFSVSHNYILEAKYSLSIIAISLPFVILQGASVSVLEAFGHFKYISLTKTPFSVLMYALPAIISIFSSSLIFISIALCVLRVLMAISFILLQRCIIKNYLTDEVIKNETSMTINMAIELLKYGGWVSISNIIAPIMLYIDRFFVASIVGAGFVAYYTTPFEMISKISILAVSVSGVLFPLLAKHIKNEIYIADSYYWKAIFGIGGVLIIPVIFGVVFSKDILVLWINESFSEKSFFVFQLFMVGFFIHGLIQPAYIWIQAAGKPKFTAFAHMLDLTLYVLYFPILTRTFGINGAVEAWVIRVTISLIVMHSIRYLLYKRGV